MTTMYLADIYAISSVFFIKGVMDAQSVYDPSLVEEISEMEEFTLILEGNIVKMSQSQYMKFVLSEMSIHDLLYLRGLLLNYSNETFSKELCCLLDYIYKKGCEMSGRYEGRNMKTAMNSISGMSKIFYTPEGKVNKHIWHDLIRRYLVELQLVKKRFKTSELDRYIVNQTRTQREIEEVKQRDEERKKFILSGRDIPVE